MDGKERGARVVLFHFMRKLFTRIVALLVVPALVADPTLASGFLTLQTSSVAVQVFKSEPFQTHALEPITLWMHRVLEGIGAAPHVRALAGVAATGVVIGAVVAHPHISPVVLRYSAWVATTIVLSWLGKKFGFVPGGLMMSIPDSSTLEEAMAKALQLMEMTAQEPAYIGAANQSEGQRSADVRTVAEALRAATTASDGQRITIRFETAVPKNFQHNALILLSLAMNEMPTPRTLRDLVANENGTVTAEVVNRFQEFDPREGYNQMQRLITRNIGVLGARIPRGKKAYEMIPYYRETEEDGVLWASLDAAGETTLHVGRPAMGVLQQSHGIATILASRVARPNADVAIAAAGAVTAPKQIADNAPSVFDPSVVQEDTTELAIIYRDPASGHGFYLCGNPFPIVPPKKEVEADDVQTMALTISAMASRTDSESDGAWAYQKNGGTPVNMQAMGAMIAALNRGRSPGDPALFIVFNGWYAKDKQGNVILPLKAGVTQAALHFQGLNVPFPGLNRTVQNVGQNGTITIGILAEKNRSSAVVLNVPPDQRDRGGALASEIIARFQQNEHTFNAVAIGQPDGAVTYILFERNRGISPVFGNEIAYAELLEMLPLNKIDRLLDLTPEQSEDLGAAIQAGSVARRQWIHANVANLKIRADFWPIFLKEVEDSTVSGEEIRQVAQQFVTIAEPTNANNQMTVAYRENGISIEVGNTQFGYSGGPSQISNLRIKPGNARLHVMPMEEAMGSLTIYNRAYGNTREWRTPNGVITNTGEIRKRFKTFTDFIKQIWSEEQNSDWEFFTLFDNSNVFGNPNYIAFMNGQVFHGVGTEGETEVIQSFDQPFLSLVQFPDGRLEMIEVAYVIDEQKTETTAEGVLRKYAKAYRVNRQTNGAWERGEELKDVQAFNGIPMIRDGRPAELTDLIRGGYFSDFRHVVNTPPLQGDDNLDFIADSEKRAAIETALQSVKGGLYFGSDQLNANGYALLAQAVNGPVRLENHIVASVNGQTQTIPLTPDEVRGVLARSKYQEVNTTPKNPGEMRFIGDHQLEIYFKPNPYPMLLYGETEDGSIVVQAVGGLSGRIGIAVREIAAWAQSNHIRNLFVGSQGTGSLASFAPKGKRSSDDLEMVSVVEGGAIQPGGKGGREGSSCVVAFLVKRDNPTQLSPRSDGGIRATLAGVAFAVIGSIASLITGFGTVTSHIAGYVRNIDLPAYLSRTNTQFIATAA